MTSVLKLFSSLISQDRCQLTRKFRNHCLCPVRNQNVHQQSYRFWGHFLIRAIIWSAFCLNPPFTTLCHSCQASQKITKAERVKEGVVMHVWLAGIKALPGTSGKGQMHIFGEASYLNRDKVTTSTGSKHVLLLLMELFTPSWSLLYYGLWYF
jgi:hypothetical protein